MSETLNPPGGHEPGFEIRGRFYPSVSIDEYRLGDTRLVYEVTGIVFHEFYDMLNASADAPPGDDEKTIDTRILMGAVAVAIWQKFPDWRLEQVTQYVERLRVNEIEFVGMGAGPEDLEEPVPLDEPGATSSASSSPTSNGTPESPSEPSTPDITGPLDSPVGAPV